MGSYGFGIASALAAFSIYAKSYFFLVFVVLAFIVLVMYSRRPPKICYFAITDKGFFADGRFYKFPELRSFWISHDFAELSLETTHTLFTRVQAPLGDTPPGEVHEILSRFIPEAEHKDHVWDQLMRILRF